MDPGQGIDRLEFDDQSVFDNEVHEHVVPEKDTLVTDRQRLLGDERQSLQAQLDSQGSLVDRFQEPRTEFPMNFDCGLDHPLSHPVAPRRPSHTCLSVC